MIQVIGHKQGPVEARRAGGGGRVSQNYQDGAHANMKRAPEYGSERLPLALMLWWLAKSGGAVVKLCTYSIDDVCHPDIRWGGGTNHR